MSSKAIALALIAAALSAPVIAADLSSRKAASAPPPVVSACTESEGIPTDAFGFTTGSDVADTGSFGTSLTYGGGFGTRGGSSNSHGLTLQGSYGLFPCFEIGPYVLGNITSASAGGVSADSRAFGAGVEMKYKLLGRDMHGLGLTLVIDPSLNRTDPDGAGRFTSYNTGIRLFADKTLIPNTLYAGLNISHDLTWTGPSPYQRSSTFTIGGALAWQVSTGSISAAKSATCAPITNSASATRRATPPLPAPACSGRRRSSSHCRPPTTSRSPARPRASPAISTSPISASISSK